MPGHPLDRFGLADALQQPQSGPVTIQTVHVIQDDEFIPVTIQFAVQPKGGSATVDPTGP